MNHQSLIFDYDIVIKAEQSVLGSVFFDNKVMDDLVTILNDDDFYSERHSLIFRAFKHLYNKGIPIDPQTMVEALVKRKQLEDAGGVGYLSELAQSRPSAQSAIHYAGIVSDYSLQRKGIKLSEDILAIARERDYENQAEFYAAIDSLVSQLRPKTNQKLRSVAETQDEYAAYLDSTDDLIPTGFKSFDNSFGGIGRGWLYILAGRPSVGKTAKSLQMAYQMAQQDIGDILFWSQEMTFNQLKNRLLSNLTGISFARIRKKMLEQYEKETLLRMQSHMANFPLHVEDSAGITIDHIRATARQVKRKTGRIGAIFVDYLTRMDIRVEKGQTWSRAVGEVAKRFKWLAQEIEAPVILLAQLNREGAEGAPDLHHLRDSGEIEQEADLVEFLWREPDQNGSDGIIVNSTIAKGRDTGTAQFQYKFKGWIQRYEELEAMKQYEPNPDGFITNHRTVGKRNKPA